MAAACAAKPDGRQKTFVNEGKLTSEHLDLTIMNLEDLVPYITYSMKKLSAYTSNYTLTN